MSRIKRTLVIIISILIVMLIIPLITVNTVKADAGMIVTMLLFFVIYPALSVCLGILSGKDIRFFWFTPILIAILFWMFSSVTYTTAFPLVYSGIYLVVTAIAMIISWQVAKRKTK